MSEPTPRPVPIHVKAALLIFLLGAVALTFLWPVEAQGQATPCPPEGPPACADLLRALPCPYPEQMVTPADRAWLSAQAGPWRVAGTIPPGLAREYQTLEEYRVAIWPLPYGLAYGANYHRGDEARLGSRTAAWYRVVERVKPRVSPGLGFQDAFDEVSVATLQRFTEIYGSPPTAGQLLGALGARYAGRWWPDSRIDRAALCVQSGGPVVPPPVPVPQPPPVPVPPSPPPPPEPECEPEETSRWAAKCVTLGHPDLAECRAWTLANSQSRTVAKLLMVVCPEEGPPPPPPPVETCTPGTECSWATKIFIPDKGSTAVSTTEVVCRRVECPGEVEP